jgi:hypothetical protein
MNAKKRCKVKFLLMVVVFFIFVVYLASHVGRNYNVKFQHCVDWGRMPFYHELSFFLKLCIFVVP